MPTHPFELTPGSENDSLLPYVVDLELQVNRLRTQRQHLEHEAQQAIARIRGHCVDAGNPEQRVQSLFEIEAIASEFEILLRDLHEQPGYHAALDQVAPIAARPVIEQVFRWHQRLQGAPSVSLRLELDIDHVDWFPARFRHIVDGLLANALQHGAPAEGEKRVTIALRSVDAGYELRVADNGPGMSNSGEGQSLQLFQRARPGRAATLGVGLAVTKTLVEQSGGSLTIDSAEGRGTTCVAVLPRFVVDDYLD